MVQQNQDFFGRVKILTFSFYKHNYTIIMSDDERDQGDEPQEEVEDKEDKDDDEGGKKKKDPKKKFEVKKWNAVALWAWGTNYLPIFKII